MEDTSKDTKRESWADNGRSSLSGGIRPGKYVGLNEEMRFLEGTVGCENLFIRHGIVRGSKLLFELVREGKKCAPYIKHQRIIREKRGEQSEEKVQKVLSASSYTWGPSTKCWQHLDNNALAIIFSTQFLRITMDIYLQKMDSLDIRS